MKKWLIIYSSVTGNTKYIAEAMAEALPAEEVELRSTKNPPESFEDYEVVLLGYWLTRGGPAPDMEKVLKSIHHSTVILFQTHGAEVGSEHANTGFARAAKFLAEDNYILGTFGCQGRINPQLLARRQATDSSNPHAATARNKARWAKAANHPNEEDQQLAQEFINKMVHKLELRKKYLARSQA